MSLTNIVRKTLRIWPAFAQGLFERSYTRAKLTEAQYALQLEQLVHSTGSTLNTIRAIKEVRRNDIYLLPAELYEIAIINGKALDSKIEAGINDCADITLEEFDEALFWKSDKSAMQERYLLMKDVFDLSKNILPQRCHAEDYVRLSRYLKEIQQQFPKEQLPNYTDRPCIKHTARDHINILSNAGHYCPAADLIEQEDWKNV